MADGPIYYFWNPQQPKGLGLHRAVSKFKGLIRDAREIDFRNRWSSLHRGWRGFSLGEEVVARDRSRLVALIMKKADLAVGPDSKRSG
jgi:hypothetical protein